MNEGKRENINNNNNNKFFWLKDDDGKDKETTLSSIRNSLSSFLSPPLRIMRVSQIDTDLLDFELFDILKEQLWQIFTLFKPQFRVTFEPELLALLQFIMYRLSIYESGASYGAQLQNLKYRNERQHGGLLQSTAKDAPLTKFQKYAFGIMTIGGQYVWMRMNRIVTAQGWGELEDNNPRKIFWKILQKVENIYRVLSLLNFFVFLYDGKYRNLIDKILSMRLVYDRRTINRQISFEFLNRQLVWHAFTEFLLFLMPLINLRKLKNILQRKLLPASFTKSKLLNFLPPHICAICYENQAAPTTTTTSATTSTISTNVNSTKLHNPYETNCGHRYCYYCIKIKLIQEDGSWGCLRCGEVVKEITRVFEKVIDEEVETSKDITNNKGNKTNQPFR
ncbi:hypothetical protein Glove_397g8 [Diversispora epigaea]|uniref:RING-type E3 ubiquitin transferase (cysteine targeting) n=1 Tax=Diversispora epigaea TaxID=1348612 RepID=A0A397H1Y8_9GLOM|nr:hypothetical protein Glove_397g8 [Diversispora epigaea]